MPNLTELNSQLKRLLNDITFNVDKDITSYEKEIIKLYKNALMKIRNEISSLDAQSFNKDFISYRQLNEVADSIQKILSETGNITVDKTSNAIIDSYHTTYNQTGTSINSVINAQFGVIDKNAANVAIINPYSSISWPTLLGSQINNANSIIRKTISEGIVTGKSYNKLAKVITDQLNITTGKAMNILRTETHRATQEARVSSLKDVEDAATRQGYKLLKVWLSSHLPNSRHDSLDGIVADENDQWFYDDGTATIGPGLSGDPHQDINCQCQIITELSENNS